MTEIIKMLIEASKERIENPIIKSFIIYWIIFNWNGVTYFLFSGAPIENRLRVVEDKYDSWAYNLWWPLGMAFFFVLAFPWLMVLVDWLIIKVTEKRKDNALKLKIYDIKRKRESEKEEKIKVL